jgi:NADPH2:quinone reductase
MAKAIRIHATGGPEVLSHEDVEPGHPGPGQARIKQTAIGLNYIDIYHRTGLYPAPLPTGLGLEAAGIVLEVGPGVTEVKPGDRVAYAGGPLGSYATERVMPVAPLVVLRDDVDDQTAAASMLQGMTVEYLLNRTYPVKAGDTILIHAAAGGVGLIAGQWAKAIGARAIGTVSSDAKADLARANGYAEVIVTTREKISTRVRELTDGKGVPVVYDSVGKDTFFDSLDCLSPRGYMVSFGNASGPVPAIEPAILGAKGSLFLTRPSLMAYTSTRAELTACANALFAMLASGKVKVPVRQSFALKDVADAHRALESRATVGSTILLP